MTWRSYTRVTATEPNEIQFQGLTSSTPVVGTSTSSGRLITVESTALVFTGFDIAGVVGSIELRLRVDRLARTQDKTIQLWWDGAARAANLADARAEDVWIYRWEDVNTAWSEDHGVIIDLQPHAQFPSANTVYIRSVELRSV